MFSFLGNHQSEKIRVSSLEILEKVRVCNEFPLEIAQFEVQYVLEALANNYTQPYVQKSAIQVFSNTAEKLRIYTTPQITDIAESCKQVATDLQ